MPSALARCRGFLRRTRARRRRPLCRCSAAELAAFARWRCVDFLAASRAAFLAAARFRIHGSPGSAFGFFFTDAPSFVALLDIAGLAFLLVGVARFVAARHWRVLGKKEAPNARRLPI